MRSRFAIFAVLILCAITLPALAKRAPPQIDPLDLARAQLVARATLDQTVHFSKLTTANVEKGASTAQLTGTATASFDGGATVVGQAGHGVTVTVVISHAGDAAFAQCRESLAQENPNRGPVDISGHGYFNVNMLNGTLAGANLTLDVVTSCDPGG